MPAQNENRTNRDPNRPAGGKRTPGDAAKRVSPGIGTVGGGYVRDDRKFGFDEAGMHVPTGNSEILLTRRQLLFGAAGLLGVAAVGGAAAAVNNAGEAADETASLQVAEGDVFTLDDCSEVDADDVMTLVGEYKLPYGSLVWAGNDELAACLLPSEKATPLVTGALLGLSSGNLVTVLDKADGADEGFEIYDIRASEEGAIWTEANIVTGAWRVFVAQISLMELQEHVQVDEGDASLEMPTLAAIGGRAWWQVVPAETDDDAEDEPQTEVNTVEFASPRKPQTAWSAAGRNACAIAPDNGDGGVVVVARDPESQSHYQLLAIDEGGTVLDSITLPTRMKPMEACYGPTGFAFSFESIYNYGDGIANLGTYTPQAKPDAGQYSNRSWFHFERTPTMPPAWCGNWFIVKSTSAVVAFDLASKRYAMFSTDNNAQAYGDCLASTGGNGSVVIFTNIDRTDSVSGSGSDDDKLCSVRVYTTSDNAGSFGSGESDDSGSDDSGDYADYA